MLESRAMPSNDALLLWLFIAAVAHIFIIFGVNFNRPEPEKFKRSIDITIVNTPAKKAPKNAETLAQENQIGAGERIAKPQPPQQKIASEVISRPKPIEKIAPKESKPKSLEKVVTRKKAEKPIVAEPAKAVAEEQAVEDSPVESPPRLSPELLQQQITQLGTEIRHSQQSGDQSKIKFVNMVSAHKYVAAQYLKDWEEKVERMGNRNYPEAAAKRNFSATLSMDVGIKVDGSIYSMRIRKSSGIPELDEAAKNIVKMSAPFAPLPLELQKELNVLVITRVWKFSDESGMTTR
ncbi:MAG: TonB family protein [Methylosarcina sp.]